MNRDGALNRAACAISDFIEKNDKTEHIHYGCKWVIRGNDVIHCCSEEKREWKVGEKSNG